MADKPTSEMSADELWGAIVGLPTSTRQRATSCRTWPDSIVHAIVKSGHEECVVNDCPYGCGNPITNGQINDGDAFPLDERGPDDQRYAHRECAQGARYEP